MSVRSKEQYSLIEALAISVAVHRDQGWVKRNDGFFDHDRGIRVYESREAVLDNIRVAHGGTVHESIKILEITENDYTEATTIRDFFSDQTLMMKIEGTLTEFNETLGNIIDLEYVNVKQQLSIIASLPNSYVIAAQREVVANFFADNVRRGSFVGELNNRMSITADVVDIRWIPRSGTFLTTMVTNKDQIVKFFIKQNPITVATTLKGKTLTFVGTVKNQEVSNWTGCHETRFNRVKIK